MNKCTPELDRFPHICSWFEQGDEGLSLTIDETPASSVSYNGIRICSGFDPEGEAFQRVSMLPSSISELTCFGVGNGLLIEQLVRLPNLKRVQIVLLDPRLSYLLFNHYEHSWLSSPKVELVTSGQIRRLPPHFVEIVGEVHAAGSEADAIRLELACHYFSLQSSLGSKHYGKQSRKRYDGPTRIAQVRPFIREDGDVAELFGTCEGGETVVVGAGPSLTLKSEELKKRRSSLTVVATMSGIKPLHQQGIVPDYVVAVDASPALYNQFAGLEAHLAHVPLIYFPTVHTSVLRGWPGPRFVAFSDIASGVTPLNDEFERGRLETDSSVSISAASLAVQLGGRRIYLIGLDFAHIDGRSHGAAAESLVEKAGFDPLTGLHWRIESYGDALLQTTPKLMSHCRAMETFVSEASGVEFLNLSNLGAKIDGVGLVQDEP